VTYISFILSEYVGEQSVAHSLSSLAMTTPYLHTHIIHTTCDIYVYTETQGILYGKENYIPAKEHTEVIKQTSNTPTNCVQITD